MDGLNLPENLQGDPAFEGIDSVEALATKYHETVNAGPPGLPDLLPEELRDDPAIKDFKDVGSLAKSFKDTQSHLGNSIKIPGEDASDEERQQFYQKLVERAPGVMPKPNFENEEQAREFYRSLGMPESKDEYELPEVEGIELDDDRIDFLRSVAHDIGATKEQFQNFMTKVMENDLEVMERQRKEYDEGFNALRKEWGAAYDEKTKAADHLREQFFPFIPKEQMGPETLKALAGLAEQIGAEGKEATRHGDQAGTLTPAQASEKIGEIMRNKEHPYWKSSDPQHEEAVKRMLELQALANPGASRSIDALRAGGGYARTG